MNPSLPQARPLVPGLEVCGQIEPTDVATLAAAGVRTLVCNRPDGESPGQPAYREIEAEARRHGLQCAFLPVVGGQIDATQVAAFDRLLAEAPGPVFAYCRSGMRCTVLWALSQAGRRPWPELLATAAAAGYDLGGLPEPSATLRG
ncbi:MAG: TIGR01244 family phosphatase [Xanthomonadaceae bacterium]|jgi:sulfide:quinone oxidoreductase|nr:TIGR01244 family phosphatase [Xanthomonadaceae bacterium]